MAFTFSKSLQNEFLVLLGVGLPDDDEQVAAGERAGRGHPQAQLAAQRHGTVVVFRRGAGLLGLGLLKVSRGNLHG